MLLYMKKNNIYFLVFFSILTFSCEKVVDEKAATFDIIQTKIFEPNCVACHTAGTSFANQSKLVLSGDQSYNQLVNRAPENAAAKNDGLLLVGDLGLESLYSSFLWEKINFPDFEHYYSDHAEYGELMPFGGPSLTYGELEFIRQWIVNGAPRTGSVVDEAVLDDTRRFEIPIEDFTVLSPPTQGLQLNLGPFDVPANFEREFYYYQSLNNAEDLYVNKFESSMKEGSHHLILYDFPSQNLPVSNQFRDIRNENNTLNFETILSISDQRFVFGTQLRNASYSFPEGVALKIPANWGFDINSHYVNKTSDIKTGQVSVNIHTVPFSEVTHIAENLFLNNTSFSLPARQITTLSKTWNFNEAVNVFMLTSHAHQYNTEFKIYISGGDRDGELVFFSKDWQHPPLITFDPPLHLEAGQGLKAQATYNNTTDKNLKFGLLSEDEMMIIFGAYYKD